MTKPLAMLLWILCGWVQFMEAQELATPGASMPEELQSASEVSPADTLQPMGDDLMQIYFSAKPEQYLLDPQKLLGGLEAKVRMEFLQYHASDSGVDLYVYLIRQDQRMPDTELVRVFMNQHFPEEKPSVLLIYPYGDPSRAELHLSPMVVQVVSDLERRRSLESAVLAALEMDDHGGQLEAFLMQMSMRVYWMERALGLVDHEVVPMEEPRKPESHADESAADLLERWEPWLKVADPWVAKVSAVSAGLSLPCLILLWRKRRARHVFVDFMVEPRLGGAHGAGVGAVISFADPSMPPASQRDFGPDILSHL